VINKLSIQYLRIYKTTSLINIFSQYKREKLYDLFEILEHFLYLLNIDTIVSSKHFISPHVVSSFFIDKRKIE